MTPPRALILAAGRGERLRPLTDITPKPLLPVRGRPMIEWHLAALARAGVQDVVINTAWLEDRFPAALGDGSRWGLRIHWSAEGRDFGGALETAGGIATALPLLAPRGDDAFWVVSGDIFAPAFDFDDAQRQAFEAGSDLGHLWLVPNPPFNARGDFALAEGGRLSRDGERAWTYANIALLRPDLVAGIARGERAALGPRLFDAAAAGRLGGQAWAGEWHNIGTPAQLTALQRCTLRPLAAADLDLAQHIVASTMRDYAVATWGSWNDDETRQHLQRDLPDGCSHIIEVDGSAAGLLRVQVLPTHTQLEQLFLLPAFQRQGLGTELLLGLVGEAAARGHALRLRVLRVNPAQRLYARLGFRVVETTAERVFMERPAP